MVDEAAFRAIALGLPGTREVPHFDRRAYRRRVNFATLAKDGLTANLLLPRERQEELVERFPDALSRVPNKFGERGWTTVVLEHVEADDVEYLLRLALEHTG